jgi:MFS family permease
MLEPLPPLYRAKFVVLLLVQFVFGLGFSSFLLLPKYLTQAHAADASTIGRVMAAGPLCAVLTLPLVAPYIDRVRRQFLLSVAAVAMFGTALGFAYLGPLEPNVYVLRALQGAAFTAFMSTTSTLVVELAPSARLGQALGLQGAANLVTNAVGPAIAEPLAHGWGWRTVFLLSALCSCLAAAGVWALAEPARVQRVGTQQRDVFDSHSLPFFYVSAVIGFGYGTIVTFYQPLALQLGAVEVGGFFIGYTITAVIVRVGFGAWLDRFRRRSLALVSAVLYALVVLSTSGLQPSWLFPLGLALGLAHGTLFPVLSALVVEGSQPALRGARLAYFNGSFNVGMIASTLGFGAVAHLIGYRWVFVLAGAVSFSALPFLARTRPAAVQG